MIIHRLAAALSTSCLDGQTRVALCSLVCTPVMVVCLCPGSRSGPGTRSRLGLGLDSAVAGYSSPRRRHIRVSVYAVCACACVGLCKTGADSRECTCAALNSKFLHMRWDSANTKTPSRGFETGVPLHTRHPHHPSSSSRRTARRADRHRLISKRCLAHAVTPIMRAGVKCRRSGASQFALRYGFGTWSASRRPCRCSL